MHSALYDCEVMHHRLQPKVYRFRHRAFYLWLDLDELDELDARLRLFTRNRRGLFAFFDRDHIVRDGASAKAGVLEILAARGVDTAAIARVRLLTFPRILGYLFNPVCFYYCFDAQERPVCAVAEVTNTFREQKPYVLTRREGEGFRLETPKHFYVSPFFGLDVCFDFQLGLPGERLDIRVDDRDAGQRVLLTRLSGRRRPLTDRHLLVRLFTYPLLTLRVITLIHWHALRLWLKRLHVHRKRDQPELQRDLYRPHASLTSPRP